MGAQCLAPRFGNASVAHQPRMPLIRSTLGSRCGRDSATNLARQPQIWQSKPREFRGDKAGMGRLCSDVADDLRQSMGPTPTVPYSAVEL